MQNSTCLSVDIVLSLFDSHAYGYVGLSCDVRWMSDDIIESLTQSMIAPRPNTYTYTKAIAESLLVELCSASRLPCAIVRPSIVGASWQQPVAVSNHFCNYSMSSRISMNVTCPG